MEDWITEIEIK